MGKKGKNKQNTEKGDGDSEQLYEAGL